MDTKQTKQLEIGRDYAGIFGVSAPAKMLYLGGIKWRAEKPGASREMDSQAATDKALAYINQPAVHMGM